MPKQILIGSLNLLLGILYLSAAVYTLDISSIAVLSFEIQYMIIMEGVVGLVIGLSLLRGYKLGYLLGIILWVTTFIFTTRRLFAIFMSWEYFLEYSKDITGQYEVNLFLTGKLIVSAWIIYRLGKELFKKHKVALS